MAKRRILFSSRRRDSVCREGSLWGVSLGCLPVGSPCGVSLGGLPGGSQWMLGGFHGCWGVGGTEAQPRPKAAQRLVYPYFSRRTVDRRRRTVDRLGRLNMQPPVLHSGATLADERRQMPSRPAGERPSGENARHNGRVAVWRKLALESRERAALCSERFRPMSV